MELLLPDRVEVAINGLGPLLGLAHLNSDIWITGSCLVLCLKSLGTNNCCSDRQRRKESVSNVSINTNHFKGLMLRTGCVYL